MMKKEFSFNNVEVPPETVCEVRNLYQTLESTEVLHGLSFEINPGVTVINGESGSGKSTLFTCMAGLRKVTEGDVIYGDSINLAELDKSELTDWRGQNIGIVYQTPLPLNGYNALTNIIAAQSLIGRKVDIDRIEEVTKRLRIFDKLQRETASLSGGEKQRVAIARALIGNPKIIFADEPTASLGSEDTDMVHELLRESVDVDGSTLVMVSHEEVFKQTKPAYADRIITLKDGFIEKDKIV